MVTAMRQDGLLDQLRGDALRRVFKIRWKRHHHIARVNTLGPVRQEAAHFVKGLLRWKTAVDLVAPARKHGRRLAPGPQQWVDAQRGGEAVVTAEPFLPDRALQGVKGRVRHEDLL